MLLNQDWGLGYFYRILMDALPEKGGSLPADPAELAANLGMPEELVSRCIPILERFGKGQSRGGIVVKDDGTLQNRRITEDLMTARKRKKRLREGGRRGGLRSAQGRVKPGLSNGEPIPTPLPKPLPLPSPKPLPKPLPEPTIPEGAREQAIPNNQAEKAFDALVAAYPPEAVQSRFAAQHAFSEVLPWLPCLADLLDALKAQKRSDQWQRGKVPALQRWLRERMWTGTVGAKAARGTGEAVDEQLAAYVKGVDG